MNDNVRALCKINHLGPFQNIRLNHAHVGIVAQGGKSNRLITEESIQEYHFIVTRESLGQTRPNEAGTASDEDRLVYYIDTIGHHGDRGVVQLSNSTTKASKIR